MNLVESLAEKIAMHLLMGHEQMNAVEIRVTKPHVALNGPLTSVGMAPHFVALAMHPPLLAGSKPLLQFLTFDIVSCSAQFVCAYLPGVVIRRQKMQEPPPLQES